MKTKLFSCSLPNCQKLFKNKKFLQKHLKHEHSNNEVCGLIGHTCFVCNKVLSTKQGLKEHSYIHAGQKPYKCNEQGCELYFRQSSLLSVHKKFHKEVKKFMNSDFNHKCNEVKRESFEKNDNNNESAQVSLPLITGPQVGTKLNNIFI